MLIIFTQCFVYGRFTLVNILSHFRFALESIPCPYVVLFRKIVDIYLHTYYELSGFAYYFHEIRKKVDLDFLYCSIRGSANITLGMECNVRAW